MHTELTASYGRFAYQLCGKNTSRQKFMASHGIALASRLMPGGRRRWMPSARGFRPAALQVLDLRLNSPLDPHCPAFNQISQSIAD